MRTLDFAAKYIRFDKTSPVTGPFRITMYPFLAKPLDASDDIRIKRLVIYKASSCLGTVLGQIINTKRIAVDVGDQIMVCQTDDDASKWTKTRGKEWLESVPTVMRLLKNDKYAQTNDLWLFRHKFLKISGPGITAAQSDQVRYVQTDESHLEAYPPGRLVEFEKRMGARWDRQATHITTAADEGKEVDQFYYQGTQEEWHWRCTKCNELILPLWDERAKEKYNGERIFVWREYQSETATLESIFAKCPYCDAVYQDTSRERYSLQRDADYISMNPNAPIEFASFQWAAFAAAHWMPWREFLAEHLAAIAAAKMGDLKPHEDFVKKRECRSYRPTLPDFGDSHGETNYTLGQSWDIPDFTDILTADLQAGKRDEGGHLWALVTRWDREGNSRRMAYRRLPTWASLRAMQLEFKVEDKNVYVDSGYDNRTVFWECSQYHWYATRGDAAEQLYHKITMDRGKPTQHIVSVPMPYSQAERQNGNVGSATPTKLRSNLRGTLPPGWCLCVVISNPQIYSYLHALQSGVTGRYFGVASDMPTEYTDGFPAFIPVVEKNKRTNVESIIWRKVKRFEHPWDLECMALVGACRAGYYPLKASTQETKPELIEV